MACMVAKSMRQVAVGSTYCLKKSPAKLGRNGLLDDLGRNLRFDVGPQCLSFLGVGLAEGQVFDRRNTNDEEILLTGNERYVFPRRPN